MAWYKKAKIETLKDRNKINDKIKFFKKSVEILYYLKKYVYQNAPHAKRTLKKLTDDKVMSSFPQLRELMQFADSKALDNYNQFSEICSKIIDKFMSKIKDLEKERKSYSTYLADKIKDNNNDK